MKTEVIGASEYARAVALLREGEIVALPTETVYGLAADALNALAVAKVFEAKERPFFDPLIVHLPDRDWLEKLADLQAEDRPLILKLADNFWPGPSFKLFRERLDADAAVVQGPKPFDEVGTGTAEEIAPPHDEQITL